MFREIVPEKVIQARGKRTRGEVARVVGNKVTEQDIYCYETGKHLPSKKKLPYLLLALGTTYDNISEPVEFTLS